MEGLTAYRILFQAIFSLRLRHCIGLHFASQFYGFLEVEEFEKPERR